MKYENNEVALCIHLTNKNSIHCSELRGFRHRETPLDPSSHPTLPKSILQESMLLLHKPGTNG
jgi:hypothetical protein